MSNAGRWQAVDPEPGAPRSEPAPDPTPEIAPETHVDLVQAEQAEPHNTEPREAEPHDAEPRPAAAPVGTVEIEAVLTEDEYRQLLAAAAEAGKTPNDFLRQAVRDAWFFRRNAPPGSKILIVSGGKVHTVK
jgi:hypothetical protein